jgi:diguanylate cyclase (GGDEF)-like protein
MIFSVNFILSINNIKDYLETESVTHAQDTATALGLALSPHLENKDNPMIETVINAIFDRGYYKQIRLVNDQQKNWVTLTNDPVFDEVPEWFIRLFPMKTASAETEINSGWRIAGKLYVTINPGYGYLKLYKQSKKSLFYSLIAFIFAFMLLTLTLRLTLQPLKKIETLAKIIGNGDFTTLKRMPWTTEVKNVAVAMNGMSEKISLMIKNLNQKLETSTNALQLDPLTRLWNHEKFKTDLKHLLAEKHEGHVLLIKVNNLGELSNRFGSEKVDQFLMDFAAQLRDIKNKTEQITGYRLFGAEFALITNISSENEIELLAKTLNQNWSEITEKYQIQDIGHIGIARYTSFCTVKSILAAAYEALEQARKVGSNSFFITKTIQQAKDLRTWKSLIEHIIETQTYQLKLINQTQSLISPKANTVIMEEAFCLVKDNKQQNLATGTFIALAEKFDKVIELDNGIISQIIKKITNEDIKHPITINLSIMSVQSSLFRAWLTELLRNNSAIVHQLVFSLTAYSVINQQESFIEFINFLHQMGAKVILKRYEPHLLSLDEIKQFNLDYLRLARSITRDINDNTDKVTLITSIKESGDLLNFKVLAENILSLGDMEALRKIGIYGASLMEKK